MEEGMRLAVARGKGGSLQGIEIAPPSLTLVSSVTGRSVESGDGLDEAYWQRQARAPAAFDRCVESLEDLGVQVVVEIGPDAVLGPVVASVWPDSAGGVVSLSSLRRDSQVEDGFLEAVAGAYEAGLGVSFAGLFAGETRRRISLPGYPFQRRRHWVDRQKRMASSDGG
jgi:acyl transferase domain-containing protein